MFGATMELAKDGAGKIGQIKLLPANIVSLDWTHISLLETAAHYATKGETR